MTSTTTETIVDLKFYDRNGNVVKVMHARSTETDFKIWPDTFECSGRMAMGCFDSVEQFNSVARIEGLEHLRLERCDVSCLPNLCPVDAWLSIGEMSHLKYLNVKQEILPETVKNALSGNDIANPQRVCEVVRRIVGDAHRRAAEERRALEQEQQMHAQRILELGPQAALAIIEGDECEFFELFNTEPLLWKWRDSRGNSLLHLAARRSAAVKIIDRLLVACGTSGGGVVNKAGSTPLHEAVANNQLNITRLLVQRGRLTIDARNKQGETPLDIARRFQFSSIVEYFESLVDAQSLNAKRVIELTDSLASLRLLYDEKKFESDKQSIEHSLLLSELAKLEQQIIDHEQQLETLLRQSTTTTTTVTTTSATSSTSMSTSASSTSSSQQQSSPSQQQQQQQRPNIFECIVCFEGVPNMLGDSCSHLCVCEKCSSVLALCPKCRKPINAWRKLFIS